MRKVIITFKVDEAALAVAVDVEDISSEEALRNIIASEPLSFLEAEDALRRVEVKVEGGD